MSRHRVAGSSAHDDSSESPVVIAKAARSKATTMVRPNGGGVHKKRKRPAGVRARRTMKEIHAMRKQQSQLGVLFTSRRIDTIMRSIVETQLQGPHRGMWKRTRLPAIASDGAKAIIQALIERRLQKVLLIAKCLLNAGHRETLTPDHVRVAIKIADMVH